MTPASPEPKPSAVLQAISIIEQQQNSDETLQVLQRIKGLAYQIDAKAETKPSAEALLPCPFCEYGAEFVKVESGGAYICCTNIACGVRTKTRFVQPEIALPRIWNRRDSAHPASAPANAPAATGDAVMALLKFWRREMASDTELRCADKLEAAISADKASGEVGR